MSIYYISGPSLFPGHILVRASSLSNALVRGTDAMNAMNANRREFGLRPLRSIAIAKIRLATAAEICEEAICRIPGDGCAVEEWNRLMKLEWL